VKFPPYQIRYRMFEKAAEYGHFNSRITITNLSEQQSEASELPKTQIGHMIHELKD
jgi:hypothetical protein